MSRRAVNLLLLTHLLLSWGAVVFRVDMFPLTWAPMYSVREQGGVVDVPVWDRGRALVATTRDGRVERLDDDALNIPLLSFWRLYYERAFGRPPNVFHHGNAPMEPWCYAARGLPRGAPLHEADWPQRILESVNASLGRAPNDPDFVVALEAEAQVVHYAQGDPRRWWVTDERAELRWGQRVGDAQGRQGHATRR